ncbi:MAG: hypothetical protein PHX77_03580 [Candidatus Bipolaricaulis sp.]|nr:hypothetical protein [Candidatus Bipolaricaulis sp.]MDD5645553.1 hypothetical protein [Candidatus Bipolaricaulis sp.]
MNGSRGAVCVTATCLALCVGWAAAARPSTDDVPVLLLGVVQLNGSELAVSVTQAQQLLPLVQAWRAQLEQSWGVTRGASATATAIRAILTPEQRARIEAMRLTSSDAMRWGCGTLAVWPWGALAPWGAPPPEGETPRPGFHNFMPMLDNPYLEFADRVIRVLIGWASAG